VTERARKKILIADDSPQLRELESAFLARLGVILGASDGADALEIARREQPDIVIADLEMPGLAGDALCHAIKADRDLHRTPVILVISGRSAAEHERAVRALADDILVKPITRPQLAQSVALLLGADPYRSLARAPLEEEVRVRVERAGAHAWGVMCDLSRGGTFIESAGRLPVDTEVSLDFKLPQLRRSLQSTAQVRWTGLHPRTGNAGMGLRFLALDRAASKQIDAYVHQFTAPRSGRLATTEVAQ
jgi:uncharacterized protein (TIGR02266 family)